MKILILGGIREASILAAKLVEDGHDVTTSLAGRTREPEPVAGKCRIGGFGGVEGLAQYLEKNAIDQLIDCTHPFARQISANAVAAAKLANVELEVHTRKPWQEEDGDQWIEVHSLKQACDAIPQNARVLLALGSQYIDLFKTRKDVFYLVRMVDKPQGDLPLPQHKLLLGKPSAKWQDEMAVLKANSITHVVCRNSGGPGAYAKIEAARNLQIPVIMVQQ